MPERWEEKTCRPPWGSAYGCAVTRKERHRGSSPYKDKVRKEDGVSPAPALFLPFVFEVMITPPPPICIQTIYLAEVGQ